MVCSSDIEPELSTTNNISTFEACPAGTLKVFTPAVVVGVGLGAGGGGVGVGLGAGGGGVGVGLGAEDGPGPGTTSLLSFRSSATNPYSLTQPDNKIDEPAANKATVKTF